MNTFDNNHLLILEYHREKNSVFTLVFVLIIVLAQEELLKLSLADDKRWEKDFEVNYTFTSGED